MAYLCPADGATPSPAELRELLGRSLPAHMVPALFVVLDAMPLTENGKLDRSALPMPEFDTRVGGRPPGARSEQVLCGVFSEVLGVSEVGVEENFFELGGDSIMAIQLVSKARRDGLVLTLRDVFAHPTVAGLSGVCELVDETAVPVSRSVDGVGPVPLTPIAHWLRERGGPTAAFHQSLLVQVPEGLREEDLVRAVQTLLDHHDALRLRLTRKAAWVLEVAE